MKEKIKSNAKELRAEMTKQEKHLWYDFLSKHSLHWYRQRPIGNYILDFYCPTLRLGIELDGSQHYTSEGLEYDKNRTEVLNRMGINILRILNKDIDDNFINVCEYIESIVEINKKNDGC